MDQWVTKQFVSSLLGALAARSPIVCILSPMSWSLGAVARSDLYPRVRAMFLVAVLVGECVVGTSNMYPPPQKPHSSTGERYEQLGWFANVLDESQDELHFGNFWLMGMDWRHHAFQALVVLYGCESSSPDAPARYLDHRPIVEKVFLFAQPRNACDRLPNPSVFVTFKDSVTPWSCAGQVCFYSCRYLIVT